MNSILKCSLGVRVLRGSGSTGQRKTMKYMVKGIAITSVLDCMIVDWGDGRVLIQWLINITDGLLIIMFSILHLCLLILMVRSLLQLRSQL